MGIPCRLRLHDRGSALAGGVVVLMILVGMAPPGTEVRANTGERMAEDAERARERALMYLDRAHQAAGRIEHEERRRALLWRLAQARARAGDGAGVRQALAEHAEVGDGAGSLWLSRRVLELLLEAGAFDGAKRIAADIEDASQRHLAYKHIAIAEAEAGAIDEAIVTATYIDSDRWQDEAYVDIALAKARAGQMDRALENVKGLLRPRLQAGAYRGIGGVLFEAGDEAKAVEVMQRAMDRAKAITGEPHRAQTMKALARQWDELGNQKASLRALELAAKTILGYPQPYLDAEVPAELAEMLHDRGREELAGLMLVHAAEQLQRHHMRFNRDDELAGVRHSSRLRQLHKAQLHMGDFDGAWTTAQMMEEAGSKDFLPLAIARKQARAGDFTGIRQQARDRDDIDEHWVEVMIADVKARAGDLDAASEIADGIEDEAFPLSARFAMTVGRLVHDDVERAIRALEELVDEEHLPDTKAMVFSEAARIHADAGDHAAADKMIDRAVSAADRIDDPVARLADYSHATGLWLELEKVPAAQAMAEEAAKFLASLEEPEGDWRYRQYWTLAEFLRKAGDEDGADRILGRARDELHRLNYTEAASWHVPGLARRQLELGDVDGSRVTADMREDVSDRLDLYREIAAAYAKTGDEDSVETWLADTDSAEVRGHILVGAACGSLKASGEGGCGLD